MIPKPIQPTVSPDVLPVIVSEGGGASACDWARARVLQKKRCGDVLLVIEVLFAEQSN
jgi:hypothetical protein